MSWDIASRAGKFASIVSSMVVTDGSGAAVAREAAIESVVAWLRQVREDRNRLYIIGNGGSSAIAAHAVNDFVNVARISAYTLHDPAILTCMANDYGYENAYVRLLNQFADSGDLLVAISSSGRSPNICKAVETVKSAGGRVVTLSGFKPDNPLRKLGDLNIWLDASDYGMLEIGHQFVLHNVSDRMAAECK